MSKLLSMMMSSSGGGGIKTGYIETDCTGQYIDLSILTEKVKIGDVITITFQTPTASSFDISSFNTTSDYLTIFGNAYKSNSHYYYTGFMLNIVQGLGKAIALNNNNAKDTTYQNQVSTYSNDKDSKLTLSFTKSSSAWDNETYNILKGNLTGLTCRFWQGKVTRDGVDVINVVGAEENGVVGVYDTVSQTFIGNSGTGVLTFVEE